MASFSIDSVRKCRQKLIECPYTYFGCDAESAPKEVISIHIRDDTLTHSQLLIELIHNLKNEISGLKEDFGVSKLEISTLKEELRMKDVQIESLNGEITEQKRKAETHEREMENQKRDTNKLKKEIASLKRECDKREMQAADTQREMMDEMEEQRKCVIKLELEIEKQKRERNEIKKEIERLKGESCEKKSATTVTPSKNDLRTRVNALAETVNVQTNKKLAVGLLSITVDKFNARQTTEEVILSPYFYSHTNGYKLRLRVDPGGYGHGKGTHLSVFIRICQGEYDDVLPWPCKHTFIVSIINQRNEGIHASWTLNYAKAVDNLKYTFDKPINKDNNSYGYSKFVTHAELQSVIGLVVDDTVLVRCVISDIP